MPKIRPVSDLRNNFAEISKIVHENQEPVFLTKNGYGDMVVMSIDQYEKMQLRYEIFTKLKEADLKALATDVKYSDSEIFGKLKEQLTNGKEK